MNLAKPTDRAQVVLSRQSITITEWSRRQGISMLPDPACTIGVPGWPDLAACTVLIESVRIVLIANWTILSSDIKRCFGLD